MIDRKVINEYLQIIDEYTIYFKRLEIVDIEDIYLINRISRIENGITHFL